EDGIRDFHVTGVQTCALPISCGFSPPGVSQALNPTLEALGLRRHKTGVMKGMSQDRNALHGGKEVHGKAVGVFPLPECPKLALRSEERRVGKEGSDWRWG